MSGFKGIVKGGWHPQGRDGKKESWRNDFKGVNQVAGWMGKGKDKDDDRETHVSRPLGSLKDPSSFAPPPKHVKYHGAAAVSSQSTQATPDRGGLGAPLTQSQINDQYAHQQQQEAEEEEERRQAEEAAKRPPVPYRADRTGLDTSGLLPPPRRVGSVASSQTSASPKPKPPSVPPRVPPRTSVSSTSHTPSPPPAYSPVPSATEQSQPLEGELNQDATSRLNHAGVSVPALGIGARPSNPTSPPAGYNQASVNELQGRFSQMRTDSASSHSSAPPPPVRQTQSPASSGGHVANAKSAISDFRSRHSDKIDTGKQKLTGVNQKYGITNRINNAIDSNKSVSSERAPPVPPYPGVQPSPTGSSTDTTSLAQRKAPPPPPPQKKAGLRAAPVSAESPAPPPLPLGTKPR